MEQFEMNFDAPKRPEEMTDAELVEAYKQAVGMFPRIGISREMQEDAVSDPEAERQRLHDEDSADDKTELERNYRR